MSSASGSNTLSVEVEASNSQQEMDLDSISLHSGDYLENITSDDHDPHPEDSETIVVSNADVDAAESQVDFLEKENNLLMSTEETVESSDNIEISNISPTEHVIVSSSGNLLNSKIQMTTVGASSTEKIIASKTVPSRGHQNVLQRPLSMSNVSSFKKPVTSLAAGPRNIMSGQQIIISSSSSNKQSYVKIVQAGQPNSNAKTITLTQAQKLGLLSGGKLQQILPAVSGGKNIIINKMNMSSPKKITMMKSPAKILPAPGPPSGLKSILPSGKIMIKQSALKGNTTNQVIRIPASQMSSLGIQQIQIPGSQKVQYVRIVQTSGPGSGSIIPRTLTHSSGTPTTVYLSNTSTTSHTSNNAQVKMFSLRNNTNTAPSIPTSSNTCILLPASYISDIDSSIKSEPQLISLSEANVELKPQTVASDTSLVATENVDYETASVQSEDTTVLESKMTRTLEPNGIRPRKPCNCTKSMCLKLYCDCFANGEFCYQCNCNSCFNNIEHEDDRHHAIRQCLERNPNAFRPKIGKCLVGEGERRHTKGCNCKRSGCLKNYCECYEAKIPCSNNCKCVSCRNVEENLFLRLCQSERSDKPSEVWKTKILEEDDHNRQWSTKLAFSFMSETIVSATCHCLFAQADKAKKSDIEEEELQKIILEECGNCLQQIIVIASKSLSQKNSHSNS